ncbi:MAG: mevalonate kinase [Oligoflexia bacterium]|nr:MAG: mevalonate kinase [Oligoflexia bacterium]
MNLKSFETKVTGKWILAGEHAVLRGCPALVFPLSSRTLEFKFTPSSQAEGLKLVLQGEHGGELELLVWGVIEKACELKKIHRNRLSGTIEMTSRIPVGAGLGASAALSVALSRWFLALGVINQDEVYEFARNLENLFHGESSGVDIAVAMGGEPLQFVRGGAREPFQPKWQPKWYVSYSGKRGVTVECVNRVKDLIQSNPSIGNQIDDDMRKAVLMAREALLLDEKTGLALLKQSMDLAHSCFVRWGLVEGVPGQHLQWLRDQGAIAVKPTGSGNGGYCLSLWSKTPPAEALSRLIPCQ